MVASATILLLNGPGSAGKSTLARALQSRTTEPFLHVSMDTFLEMQPPRHDNHPDTFFWTTKTVDGHPVTSFQTGLRGAALLRAFRRSIAALAVEGWNVIADDVADAGDWADYRQLLSGYKFLTVKVHAPLDVLEQRERERGDRMIGLSRDQWVRIHEGIDYDFDVDTAIMSPSAAADRICTHFGL